MSSPTPPTRTQQLPRPDRARSMAGTAALVVAAYVVLGVGALVGRPSVFAVGAVLVVAAEVALGRRTPFVAWTLRDNGIGPLARSLVRGLAALALLARCDAATSAVVVAVLAWVLLLLLGAAASVATEALGWLRKAPVLSRNLELGPALSARVPRQPTGLLRAARWVALADIAVLLGLAHAAKVGRDAGSSHLAAGLGGAVTVAAAGVLSALLLAAVQRHRRLAPRPEVPRLIQEAVELVAPEVVLYHSGEVSSTYQLDAWTEPLESAGRSVLVVVRSPEVLRRMRPTSLPVVYLGPASTAVGYSFGPRARVALVVGNGRGNIHLFRRHGLAFVFVGHGDSDKATSATPLARVYEQIWVAGRAARERYVRAGVRVDPEAVVEIGRPQLAGLSTRATVSGAARTVLYAPTWEGWGDEAYVASLGSAGVALVRRLLAEPGVRVVYRPHPLTGTREPALRRAHQSIVGLLTSAGGTVVRAPDAGRDGADVDDLQACVDDHGPAAAVAARAASRAASQQVLSGPEHLVVAGGWPDLVDCLDASDLMVGDISAVLTDWLAVDRPYVVLHSGAEPVEEFVAAHPSAAGATVVGPDLAGLDAVLADLRSGADPTAPARRTAAVELLGPRDDDALAGLRAALDGLLAD